MHGGPSLFSNNSLEIIGLTNALKFQYIVVVCHGENERFQATLLGALKVSDEKTLASLLTHVPGNADKREVEG